MRLDDTLHFDHTTAHPSEFFAPAHFATNEYPSWTATSIGVAVVLLVLAGITVKVFTSKKAGAVLGGAAVLLIAAGAGGIALRGEGVHPLPSKSREFMQLSTPGDDLELFSTYDRALASAEETSSRWDMPTSTARVITYRWNEWPKDYVEDNAGHPRLASDDPGWTDGPYDGWNAGDDAIIDRYVERTYGAKRMDKYRVEAVRNGISPEVVLNTTNYVQLPTGQARCILTFHELTTNFMGAPVSATPDRLECTTEPIKPFTSTGAPTPQLFYPPKVG